MVLYSIQSEETLIAQGYDTLKSGLMIFVGLFLGNTLVALLSETHVADELKVVLDFEVFFLKITFGSTPLSDICL